MCKRTPAGIMNLKSVGTNVLFQPGNVIVFALDRIKHKQKKY